MNLNKEVTQIIKCPNCGKTAPYQGNPYRPFCSHRCKLVDLEGWLTERYRISSPMVGGRDFPQEVGNDLDES